MLTRYEELVIADRDGYGRFPASASIAGRAGFLGTPVVDAYVELLWEALQRTWPGLRRSPRAFEVVLTHDVDDPLATLDHGPRDAGRQLAGDLLRRRDPRLAARRARSLLGDRSLDPHNTFDFLMDVSERHGRRSAFYFLAHRDDRPRDGAYLFEDPWVRSVIGRVGRRGHEVGLHPSFCTYRDAARTSEELARLLRVAEAEGVRQDEWGGTPALPALDQSGNVAQLGGGLARLTTARWPTRRSSGSGPGRVTPDRVFDLRERRPLRLREMPFQIMDVTLLSSMALTQDAARAAVMEIAVECRRYSGCLGILWHNNTLLRTDREKRWYEELVAAVTAT